MLNLDTHILIYALSGKLKPAEEKTLSTQAWGVSGIVLWEIAMLAAKGRVDVDVHSARFGRVVAGIQVWPIDLAVARHRSILDFQSDPADEIIAATSLVYSAPLMTRDRKLLGSAVVPLAGRASGL